MKPASAQQDDTDTQITTLPNGVRVLTLQMPPALTASVGIFVHSGSAHESRPLNGVGHFVEHMLFKGSHSRDCHQINLDAERLGAEVNAHTDKDHTAFYMRGLAADAPAFVAMLADIVCDPSFPAAEIEREREVLLQELMEVEDDPMDTAFQLFDHACWGLHPAAQPVIGSRGNLQRLARADLVACVERQYTGANLVVAAAGCIDAAQIVQASSAALAALPRGSEHQITAPAWAGGVRSRRLAGSGQTHIVLGYPLPALGVPHAADTTNDAACEMAAAVFGEGMSSPLLAELRERRGLVYHASCSADRFEFGGQFVIEASFAPDKLDELLREVLRLLRQHADRIDGVDLARARKQLTVRWLRHQERASRRIESSVLELFALGRLRPMAQRLDALAAVSAAQVQAVFATMLLAPPALAITGSVGRAVAQRASAAIGAIGPGGAAGEADDGVATR
jgi:predicted Zn-dependent peptidase